LPIKDVVVLPRIDPVFQIEAIIALQAASLVEVGQLALVFFGCAGQGARSHVPIFTKLAFIVPEGTEGTVLSAGHAPAIHQPLRIVVAAEACVLV